MTEDQTVLDSRLHPRLKEHEESNTSGIGWSKFEPCPPGFVRLSFLAQESMETSELARPSFEISENQGRSWIALSANNCVRLYFCNTYHAIHIPF